MDNENLKDLLDNKIFYLKKQNYQNKVFNNTFLFGINLMCYRYLKNPIFKSVSLSISIITVSNVLFSTLNYYF